MKIFSLKCPECGGDFLLKEGQKECYCQYCGTRIRVDDGSRTITHVYKDEAKIKEAESKAVIEKEKVKQVSTLIEANLKERQSRNRISTVRALLVAFWFIAIFLMIAFANMDGISDDFGVYWILMVIVLGIYLLATRKRKDK